MNWLQELAKLSVRFFPNSLSSPIAADIFWVYEGALGERFGDLVALVIAKAELGLWKAVYGVLAVVVMSVAGGVVLILLPSSVLYMKDFIRGARGAI
ncbi:hypothetical protein KUU39_24075 [Pseudomonas aeruginosa]|nr:hypothetical protein [Pseudomonas aeruginosa]